MLLQTLLKALDTTDLKTVVGHLSMSPLDIDLLLYDGKENGIVEINKQKGTIKLVDTESVGKYYDATLADKLIKIIKQYDNQQANITRNRMEQITLDLVGKHGYPIHDFVCTIYLLEQNAIGYPKVNKYDISVPEIKGKRPANTFTFYTLLDHQEYGAKAVNDYIDTFGNKK